MANDVSTILTAPFTSGHEVAAAATVVVVVVAAAAAVVIVVVVSNGNRTEWSPIRSVTIRVINKIGRPRNGSPICSRV